MPEKKTCARCQVAKGALIMPGGQRLMTATESEFERNVLQRFSLTVKKDVSKALSTEQPIWCWCLLRICQNWHLASMQLCFKWKSYKGPSEKTPTEIGLVSKSSTTRLPSNSAGNAWAPLAWFSLHYAAWKCARAGSGRFLCTTCSVCILGLLLKTCPLTTSPLATQLLDVNSLEWPEKKTGWTVVLWGEVAS